MDIIEKVKLNRKRLEKEIAQAKEDVRYKMYPEQSELIGCVENIVFMNQDDFLATHDEKELKNIDLLLNEAVELLVSTRGEG